MPARDMTRWTQNEDGTWRPTVHAKTAVTENGSYDDMTKAELEEALVARDLPKTGNKDELIARLQEADSA